MCWCTPEIPRDCCGRDECTPPATQTNLKEFIERIASQGGEVRRRMVSPDAYKVLEEMSAEGKLTADGLPKIENFSEYVDRLHAEKTKPKEGI